MVKDIYDCFAKLERLEQKLKAKKQAKLAQEGQANSEVAVQKQAGDDKKIEE